MPVHPHSHWHQASVCTITAPAAAVTGSLRSCVTFLFDPREQTIVRFNCSRVIVENADRGHGVVGRIDNIIGSEARNSADDREGLLFDLARKFICLASLCFALTN